MLRRWDGTWTIRYANHAHIERSEERGRTTVISLVWVKMRDSVIDSIDLRDPIIMIEVEQYVTVYL